MKQFLHATIILVLGCLSLTSFGQTSGREVLDSLFGKSQEVYFKCTIHDRSDIQNLTRIISIDRVKGNELFAYANRKEFTAFLSKNLVYTLLPHPGSLLTEMEVNPYGSTKRPLNATTWDAYPTYDQYVSDMVGFAAAHPAICRLDTVGTTVQGRLILAVKISNNVNQDEAEPELLYTSSIHGDETTGYVLMLHLIDYLLSNYGTDPAITNMVNTTAIFINPLANPDGTYHGGNGSVLGSQRYNANGIDLNRNYPDPKVGQHPDGNAWQAETQAWMAYAAVNHFTMSANFHGGSEVFNYPWDTWPKLAADDAWWQFVGREWADTVHKYSPSGYFTDEMNGITNGYAWYELNGGRQDYMNYFHNCREVTVELSYNKTLPANQLITYWNYNYHTFLNYITETHYGFNGIVTDTATGLPLAAKVYIALHDMDFSEVYSSLPSGFYARPIAEGSYNVTFSATGYFPKTISNVTVTKWNTTSLNVQLKPLSYGLQDKAISTGMIYPNPSEGSFRLVLPEGSATTVLVEVTNTLGRVIYTSAIDPGTDRKSAEISVPGILPGIYLVRIQAGSKIYVDKLVIRY
ncbi:MAG: M14 family zinc carboxypeptidase [Bacteroidota bacterium]